MIIPDILILVFAGYALTFSPIIATAKAFLYLLAFFVQAGLVLLFGGLVAIYYMVRLPDMLARFERPYELFLESEHCGDLP